MALTWEKWASVFKKKGKVPASIIEGKIQPDQIEGLPEITPEGIGAAPKDHTHTPEEIGDKENKEFVLPDDWGVKAGSVEVVDEGKA